MDQVLEKVHYYLMPRYQILVEYAGSNFRGWQVQKKGKTVQGLIQEKISKLLKEKIIIYGAGRLDSGVHAKEQSAHFDYNIEIKNDNEAYVEMTLTSPNCPVAESLPKMVKENINSVEGVKKVELKLVWNPPWTKDMMSEEAKLELNL